MSNPPEKEDRRHLSPILRVFLQANLWLVERLRLQDRQVTLLWAIVIGLFGSLADESFRRTSEFVHHLATGSDLEIISSFARLSWWQRIAVPTAGGLIAGLILLIGPRLLHRKRAKTTTDYMEAIVVGDGIVSLRGSLIKTWSALFSISTGASIGREGPLVQISALVASLIARVQKMPVSQRRQLVACGAAAGIASAYNAPIAGSFFVAEIVLGTVVVEALGPLILSSVVAVFTSQLFHGSGPIYKSPGFVLQSNWDLIPLSLVGLLAGLIAPAYLRFLRFTEKSFGKLNLPIPARLALGGAMVGAMAILSPEVCGNGQGLLISLFRQNWYPDEISAILLLKVLATAATFASGAVGGVFTPTLFIGAAIGKLYGFAVLRIAPQLHLDPAMYAIIGMGAFIAACTGAPLTSILIGFELTLDYQIAPLLMVNCIVAYYCSSLFEKRFIYGESLERKGAAFFNRQLAAARIIDLMREESETLPENVTMAEVARTFGRLQYQNIYVVDAESRLLGAISLHRVKEYLNRPDLDSAAPVADLMDKQFPRIARHQGIGEALEKFSATRADRLPVIDDFTSQRLLGSISKTDVILHLAGSGKRG